MERCILITQAFYVIYISEILSMVVLESKCVKIPNKVSVFTPLSLVLIIAPKRSEWKEQTLTGEKRASLTSVCIYLNTNELYFKPHFQEFAFLSLMADELFGSLIWRGTFFHLIFLLFWYNKFSQ